MSGIKVSPDKILPILITVLVLSLFWFSPPDLTWRIADVGESQTVRETILVVVLFGICLFVLRHQPTQLRIEQLIRDPQERMIIIFGGSILLWQWVSLIVNGLGGAGISYCILWFCYMVLFVITKCFFREKMSNIEKALQAISLSTILASLYLLLKSIENDFDCPNILLNTIRLSFGEYLVVGWTTITGLFLYSESYRFKTLWGAGLFFTTLAILQTSHRSPVLGIIVSLICLIVLSNKISLFKIKLARWVIFLGIVIIALLAQTLSSTYLDQTRSRVTIQNRILQNEEHSIGYRLFLLRVCGKMFIDHPLYGLGTGAFGKNYFQNQLALSRSPDYKDISPTMEKLGAERAHNEFAQILAENGLIGVLLIFFFLGSILFFACKRNFHSPISPLQSILISAIMGFLASSVTSGFSWRWASNGVLFFFILGLIQVKSPAPIIRLVESRLKYIPIIIVSGLLLISALWQINKSYAQLIYAKGYILAKHGKTEEATLYLLLSLKRNPENWRASFSLGKLYLLEKKQPQALDAFRSASFFRINGVDHLIILARLYQSVENPPNGEQIRELYENALSAYPQSPWPKLFYADYLLSQGETYKAKLLANEAKLIDPQLYDAAKFYFSGKPDLGQKTFISNGKVDSLNRFETLYFCK